MSEVICEDGIELIAELFQEDKDPFLASSWYSLGDKFGFASSRARRYQIAWQSSIGLAFLSSFQTSRAISAKDQLLAVVREYNRSLYESLVQNLYKGCFGDLSI